MANNYLSEIRDVNLNYLMTAQRMIGCDREQAISLLGISEEIADLLAGMSHAQIVKMASCNIMLLRFRFDDTEILSTLLRDKASGNKASMRKSAVVTIAVPETIA